MFEITKYTREISYKERNQITEGCTTNQDDLFPEVMESFETLEAAREALKAYETEVVAFSSACPYYSVTEYCIVENERDEDGEIVDGGDIWEFTAMKPEDEWRR